MNADPTLETPIVVIFQEATKIADTFTSFLYQFITDSAESLLVLQPPLEEQERVDEQARDVSVAGTDSGHAFGVSPVPPAQMKSAVSGWGRKTNIEEASQLSQAEE